MTIQLQFRQGDVGFVRCAVPEKAKRVTTRPFAAGEVTGHAHKVMVGYEGAVEMYELNGEIFIRINPEVDVPVVHEDHDPAGTTSILPAGWEGQVIIAAEYDEEEGFRRVID